VSEELAFAEVGIGLSPLTAVRGLSSLGFGKGAIVGLGQELKADHVAWG
jgi:hypothetical protein